MEAKKKKVLVVFGNVDHFGQERANIALFNSIKKYVNPIFLTHHKWGHLHIEPELDRLGFKWFKIHFPGIFRKNDSLRIWFINLYRFFTGNFEFLKYYFKIKPDYIHFANDFFFITLIPALLLIKKPIIFNIGDIPLSHFKIYRFIWKYYIIKKVKHFATVSKFIKNELIDRTCPKKKITVVYTLIPERKENLSEYPVLKKEKFRVIYFGQITKIKGIDILLKAAYELLEKYEDIEFIITGSLHFTNNYANEKFEHIKKINLSQRIIFTDYVENMPSLLKQCDLHVAPSLKKEPLGIVVLEAKKTGIPSIVFNSGGLPEMINHKNTGYICEKNTKDDLINAIEYFYKMPDQGKKIGENAKYSLTETKFSNDIFIKKWLKIYNIKNEY